MSIPATTEASTQRACLQWLAIRGVLAWRNNQAPIPLPDGKGYRAFAGRKGVSDIIGCLDDGKWLAIEVKGPRGKLTADQKAFLDDIRARHGLALVVRSLDELIAALAAEGY